MDAYWDEWLIYRHTGHRNHAGGFEPSISFADVLYVLPDDMLKVFFALDRVYDKMERQYIKQTVGKQGAP